MGSTIFVQPFWCNCSSDLHIYLLLKCMILFINTHAYVPVCSRGPQYTCEHEDYPCRSTAYNQPVIPLRIFAPELLLSVAVRVLNDYLPACLQAAFNCLGPHPFHRLDLLVLPRCFASLGFAR